MILGNLIPLTRKKSGSVTLGLTGLAFALAIGSLSMTALLHSGDALAVRDCNPDGYYDTRLASESITRGATINWGSGPTTNLGVHCIAESGSYTSTSGNILYDSRDLWALQTYDHDGDASTPEVLRPWWQGPCAVDDKQICWKTAADGSTDRPTGVAADAPTHYRLIEEDAVDTGMISNDGYAGGPDENAAIIDPEGTDTGEVVGTGML